MRYDRDIQFIVVFLCDGGWVFFFFSSMKRSVIY